GRTWSWGDAPRPKGYRCRAHRPSRRQRRSWQAFSWTPRSGSIRRRQIAPRLTRDRHEDRVAVLVHPLGIVALQADALDDIEFPRALAKKGEVCHGAVRMFGAMISRSSCRMSGAARWMRSITCMSPLLGMPTASFTAK